MKILLKYFLITNFLLANSLFAIIKFDYSFSDSLQVPTIIDSSQIFDSLKTDTTKIQRKKNIFLPPTDSIDNSTILSAFLIQKRNIDNLDYKFTGNLISFLPFSFLLDLGHTGLPSEPNLFGFGYGNSSVIIDGISYNNRWKNSFNLNDIQTESISTLSLTPLPRGFLFNTANNPITLAINTNDTLTNHPISRIRYYQAANSEAFIDAMFSAKVLPRLSILLRATNISSSNRYANTEYGAWKANFKTTYKLLNNFYSSLNYNYRKFKTNLNGGVNVNSILETTNDYKPILYNTTFAPVYFGNRYLKSTIHNVQLNLFGRLFAQNLSKINFGYENNLDEFRQNENHAIEDSTRIFNNNKYSSYNMQYEQEVNIDKLNSKLIGCYEFTDFNISKIADVSNQTNYFASILLNYKLLSGKIIPSIYSKYLNYGGQAKSGFGLDIITHPFSFIDFYIGFSSFGKPYSVLEKYSLPLEQFNKDQTVSTFLTSLKFNYSFTNTSISYFEIDNRNAAFPVFTYFSNNLGTYNITYNHVINFSQKGINLFSENKIGNILSTVNLNYYMDSKAFTVPSTPEYSLVSGLYYVDTLFSSNLDLKTGFTFYLNSEVDYRLYDFQRGQTAKFDENYNFIEPYTLNLMNNYSNRLDFFLSGRIQDKATFYFTFENLLDNQYYIVPFHPMHPRGIRIGLSWDFIN